MAEPICHLDARPTPRVTGFDHECAAASALPGPSRAQTGRGEQGDEPDAGSRKRKLKSL
jgi:hypothetical protein